MGFDLRLQRCNDQKYKFCSNYNRQKDIFLSLKQLEINLVRLFLACGNPGKGEYPPQLTALFLGGMAFPNQVQF